MEIIDVPSTKDFYCNFVLNNKILVKRIKETARVLAYYHTKPAGAVHIVVIPKQHITNLLELEDMGLVQEIFEIIKNIIKEQELADYKIITNGGKFQDSQHLHFHLVSEK